MHACIGRGAYPAGRGLGAFPDLTTRICLASSETAPSSVVSCCGIWGGIWGHLAQLRLTNPLGRSAGPGKRRRKANSGKATRRMHSLASMTSHWTRAPDTQGWEYLILRRNCGVAHHSWTEDGRRKTWIWTWAKHSHWNASTLECCLECCWNPGSAGGISRTGGWVANSQIRGTTGGDVLVSVVCLHCESCSCFKWQQTNEGLCELVSVVVQIIKSSIKRATLEPK